MSNNLFFALAGNIGVGKTTWTKLLCEKFNWFPYLEKVVENPYLSDFYDDMNHWSFHSQISFLTHRFNENIQLQQIRQSCIQDRTIFEDAEIFAYNLYQQHYMSERDFKTYNDLYKSMLTFVRFPNLLIYLRASIWSLISRIRKRGRNYEKKVDKEYLAQLNLLYDKWISNYAKYHRVLIIDTDDFDVFIDKDRFGSILKKIEAYIGQIELFPNLNTA